MKPISEDLLEALRAVRGGCAHWADGHPHIRALHDLGLVLWAEARPAYEDDPRSGPGYVLATAGYAYLAGHKHGSTAG